jgi:hypothetical protein
LQPVGFCRERPEACPDPGSGHPDPDAGATQEAAATRVRGRGAPRNPCGHSYCLLPGVRSRSRRTRAAASIEDLDSKNGTWVNGAKVEGVVRLEDGDEVRLGTITLTFRNLNAPGSTVTARTK